VLRKRAAVLVAAAVMVLSMLAASAPVFAQECDGASCEPKPGNTEMSRGPVNPPPQQKPGVIQRDPIANEKDSGRTTGRGERIEESSP
jgi:cell division septation protein DedD